MIDRVRKVFATVCCHRVLHGILACLYGASSAGVSKEIIGYAIAACYAVMSARG